jgi:5-methylthioribose kinase
VEQALAKNYSQDIESKLVQGYRGVEIMRRLIGIAQLPLKLNLGQKEVLLERAKEMIMNP